jgi:putative ABC transport system substrate-binding protein
MNRIKIPWIIVALVFMSNPVSAQARGEKKIGVLMFSEERRYRETMNGITEQLKKEGFREPDVKLTIENARDSKAKLAELVHRYASAKMDLIIAIGTPAATIAAREIKDVPIVFDMVYDPVEAGIAKDWKSSGNNTTGSCTKIPISMIMNILKELAPVKRLGVLYTPGERNSELQLLELQKVQAEAGIKVVPVIMTNKEDAAQTLWGVMRMVDALYLTGSTVVGATVPMIVEMANKGKVITLSHLADLVEKGALLGVGVDPYLVGRLAGKKAARVLKGAKPSAIPIEVEKKTNIILNVKTAKAGQFQIPPSFLTKVSVIIR